VTLTTVTLVITVLAKSTLTLSFTITTAAFILTNSTNQTRHSLPITSSIQ